MTTTFQDLLASVKAEIEEISVHTLHARLDAGHGPLVIDIREADEQAGGLIAGAVTVPRGFLELRIEGLEPRRDAPIALVCAGGTRSALSARALQQLGYGAVVSVAGGMGAWVRAGYPLQQVRQLTVDQRARYARQIILPQVGERGQLKLLDASVLCVGAGGLGCPTLLYLAAAGVGRIGIVDDDVVDRSNLQRQVLHAEELVGTPKVDSALAALRRVNSDVEVVLYKTRLDPSNVREIFEGWDVVVDGTDNFPTRYLINDACVFMGLPNVHGAIFHFDGQVSVFNHPDGGPCYRCLYPEPPPPELAPSCAEAGVLGAICGVVGSLQASEVLKLLVGAGDPLSGRILSIDVLHGQVRTLKTRPDPRCPVCSEHATITELVDYEQLCAVSL